MQPIPKVPTSQTEISVLRDLGIEKELARLSLKQANGNVDRAADIAFTIMNRPSEEVRKPLPLSTSTVTSVPSNRHIIIPKSSGVSEDEDENSEGDDNGEHGGGSGGGDENQEEGTWSDVRSSTDRRPPFRTFNNGSSEDSSQQTSSRPCAPPSLSSASTITRNPSGSTTLARPAGSGVRANSSFNSSIASSSRSSSRSKPWSHRLTSTASSSSASSYKSTSPHKRSPAVSLSSSPPGGSSGSSSRPLSHQVIRSLPLGSLVALGDQKPDKVYKPPKLNNEAIKYDAAANQLVADLFARSDGSNVSLASINSNKDSSSDTKSSRRSFFGRSRSEKTANQRTSSPYRSTPAIQLPTAMASPDIVTIPPTPINNTPSVTFEEEDSRGRSTRRLSTRSMSPFFSRTGRSRSRANSPSSEVGQLRARQGTSELADSDSEDEGDDSESNADFASGDLDQAAVGVDTGDIDNWEDDGFDEETELNTDHNAETEMIASPSSEGYMVPWSDLYQEIEPELGEGPNVVIPAADSYTILRNQTAPSTGLKLNIQRPDFGRDRCTIRIEQGDPETVLEQKAKRQRRYVVASDLSEESGYAVEWAIGTVARDGDELWIVSVQENESKVDPKDLSSQDRSEKLKVQRERQTLASLLIKQVTPILQRTNLNLTVICQAVHTKNARHMLLDLIDFLEPTIVIVGSRGLGKLKGTILGSMSHYLVQKSSVPVMVARRRLRRNLKRTDPSLLRNGAHVPLSRANVEKLATGKEPNMQDAADIEREEDLKSSEADDRTKALEAAL
ncbi:UspA [Phaffia rhodozyma]|uniref:UspA n=1 Tax=Phaffia rhodozyma TaxID=264483 RepID=A0A0F7ST77_PHARH|nr:UspA [Phaffia rhodozyma]